MTTQQQICAWVILLAALAALWVSRELSHPDGPTSWNKNDYTGVTIVHSS